MLPSSQFLFDLSSLDAKQSCRFITRFWTSALTKLVPSLSCQLTRSLSVDAPACSGSEVDSWTSLGSFSCLSSSSRAHKRAITARYNSASSSLVDFLPGFDQPKEGGTNMGLEKENGWYG